MSNAYPAAVKNFTMTWKIKNFTYTWLNIVSPPFTSRCLDKSIFYLKLDNKSLHNNQIIIRIATNNTNLSPLDYEVALVTSDGTPEEYLKEEAFEFVANDDIFDTYDKWTKETLVVSAKTIFEERRDAFLPHDTLTIRCRLQQREVDCSASEEGFICTSIGVRKKLFVWTLNEFTSGWRDECAYLFTVKETYGQLRLKASIKEECKERIVIEVHRDKGNKIFSILKISLVDVQGTERQLTSDAHFFEKSEQEQVWQLPPLMSNSELVTAKSQLLPNDALSLKCEFAASLGTVNESEMIVCPREITSSSNYYESQFFKFKTNDKLSFGSLQSDLNCILDTGSLSDFELRVDSDILPVHKVILGARSPTFNAMFTNDYKETSCGHVLVSDINSDTIRRFLIYMYTDRIENLTIENATKLYYAADKYRVLCLREICASFLKANVSSSSACEILVLADRHQDDELKSAVQHFISKHDSEILRSENWRDLKKNNHLLALETLRGICLKKSTK
ncbi:Protein roadkill [Araneus ventricosus]|uniref:Protein roadkill n=1 Tax=Araneus ventricosus TaxID=182803 RepID=A0A4Y2KFB9_ARAVE|nr:Protein roadkill [Araneus ventricosus]